MKLQFRSCLLFAGLFLSVSALTPEECQPLVTPLSLEDPSVLHGLTHLIMGYTDSAVFNEIMNASESFWMNVTASPSSDKTVVIHQEHKLKGICYGAAFSYTMEGNVATLNVGNMSASYHLLPGCDGCVILSGNSTVSNLDQYFRFMNYESSIKTNKVVNARVLYLMAKERTLKDSDLEKFKQQASCLGFSGEPDFDFDPKTDLCKEGEGPHMVLS